MAPKPWDLKDETLWYPGGWDQRLSQPRGEEMGSELQGRDEVWLWI